MELNEIKKVDLRKYISERYRIKCDARGMASCPFHPPDNHNSFSIWQGDDGIWRFKCFHENISGTIIDLKASLEDITEKEAIRELLKEFESEKSSKKRLEIEREHTYKDSEGKSVLKKIKYKKNALNITWGIKHMTVAGKWAPGKGDHELIPYNADKFKDNESVIICEGEKDADTVNELDLGLLSTSAPTGKGSWPDSLIKYFKHFKEITFLYDVGNEEDSEKHAAKLQAAFPEISIYIAKVPLYKKEADITDYLEKETMKDMAFLDVLDKREEFGSGNQQSMPLKKSFTAKELLKAALPSDPEWIGKGILPKCGYMIVGGDAKEGKTSLMIQMALSLISVHPFLDEFPVKEKPRILYIFAEGTLQGLKTILDCQITGAREKNWNIQEEELDRLIFLEARDLSLNSLSGFNVLFKYMEEKNPDIVFLDPISLFYTVNLNKLENITKLIAGLNKITDKTNCTWVLVHHYHKPKEEAEKSIHKVAGSAGWGNYCESFLGLEQAHKLRSINYKKLNFLLRRELPPEPIPLFRDPNTRLFSVINEDEITQASIKVSDVLRELEKYEPHGVAYTPITEECAKKYGVTKQRVAELLKEAMMQNKAYKEKGRYGKWHMIPK